jgi:hypothetical protein
LNAPQGQSISPPGRAAKPEAAGIIAEVEQVYNARRRLDHFSARSDLNADLVLNCQSYCGKPVIVFSITARMSG